MTFGGNQMRHKLLAIAIIIFSGMCFAQADTPADAVPGERQGKDYAGRPVEDVNVPTPAALPGSEQQQFEQDVKDVYFDFDRADLRMDQRRTLAADAEWLKEHPEVLITIEGDADERGDIVYNVDLSDQRAIATRDALVQLGVSADRIVFFTGWGKLYPVCEQTDENCWSQNRRSHFEPWEPEPTQVASR
jgi:outer membrane protein OmpA-like peptidoglycan-associated protein